MTEDPQANEPEPLLSLVPRSLLGEALMQLDRAPKQDLSQNQEYAPPGTMKWMAETVALLGRIIDSSVKSHWREHVDREGFGVMDEDVPSDPTAAEARVRLLVWWEPPFGSASSQRRGWHEVGTFFPAPDLSFAEQIGQCHGAGRYLLLSRPDRWWREIEVEVAETHYREARHGDG